MPSYARSWRATVRSVFPNKSLPPAMAARLPQQALTALMRIPRPSTSTVLASGLGLAGVGYVVKSGMSHMRTPAQIQWFGQTQTPTFKKYVVDEVGEPPGASRGAPSAPEGPRSPPRDSRFSSAPFVRSVQARVARQRQRRGAGGAGGPGGHAMRERELLADD